jgi:hypothetical protein
MEGALELPEDVTVELFGGSTEEFEGDDEEDGSDTATGEEGFGGYVPAGGDETGVYGVPVP